MVSLIKEFHMETVISSLRTSLILFPLAGSCWLAGLLAACLAFWLQKWGFFVLLGMFYFTGSNWFNWTGLVLFDWFGSIGLVQLF